MQYQIREPEGFARMLEMIIETGRLPNLEVVLQNTGGFGMESVYWMAPRAFIAWRIDRRMTTLS